MQAFLCYNEATKNARAVLSTPASVAELVTGLKENKSDMTESSTPLSLSPKKYRRRGMSRSSEYRKWSAMLARCGCPTHKKYPRYGGRGIKVCERWLTFENFYADMGNCPKGMSIERINNDSDYEPSNCRWATPREQANNRSNNTSLTVGDQTHTVAEWARIAHVTPGAIRRRLRKKLPLEDAVAPSAVPAHKRRGRGRG
jgi:hypothetical protein